MNIECEIYSPRWGHDDTYRFNFQKDKLTIKMTTSAKTSNLVWRDNLEPEWQGDNLYETLQNDFIYPPKIFKNCICEVWTLWREEDLPEDKTRIELNLLIEWLNIITKSKPQSDFWSGYF